jgi:hypothetical protein
MEPVGHAVPVAPAAWMAAVLVVTVRVALGVPVVQAEL